MNDWGSQGLALVRLPELVALGGPFLVVHGKSTHTHTPLRTKNADDVPSAFGDATGEVSVVAFPVMRRPLQDHPFVTIGRVTGNDIALDDETVSKFHAFVRSMPDGFYVQDARSKNGTVVDGVPVAQRDAGPPTKLTVGATVRFGSVVTTFVDADGLRRFALMFGIAAT